MEGWFFFFKQKTAYDMRISDWISDVCSSDLPPVVYLLQPADAAEVPRNLRAGSRFIQCEMRCRNDEKASRSSTPRARRGPSARGCENGRTGPLLYRHPQSGDGDPGGALPG